MANNLGLDPFPDPVGHFGAPWRPLWIFRPLIARNKRSALIKKLILRKLFGMPINLGLGPFPDPVGHVAAPWWPIWVLQSVRQCSRLASAPSAAMLVLYYSL